MLETPDRYDIFRDSFVEDQKKKQTLRATNKHKKWKASFEEYLKHFLLP